MDDLKLVKVSEAYKNQILAMLEEVGSADKNTIWQYAGMASLEKFSNFDDWLEKLRLEENKETLKLGRVPASTYLLIRIADNKLLGMYNIRHELNDYLLNFGGHIGYSIIPSERGKGYGVEGLRRALEQAHEIGINRVLITCNINNVLSSKVIEANGGKLENIITCPKGNIIKRYWIEN